MTLDAAVSTSKAAASAAIARRSTWYDIDLNAIKSNLRALRSVLAPSVSVIACLKRNAYGCGAFEVSRALASAGVEGFGVGSLSDALAIRAAGYEGRILMYPGLLPEDAEAVLRHRLTVTVSSECELALWRSRVPNLDVFIKIDLGFFRAGATPAQAPRLIRAALDAEGVECSGIYAHLSELGDAGVDAGTQYVRFRDILSQVCDAFETPPLTMISSTEGILKHPQMDMDAVDPGALLFGIKDVEAPRRDLSLLPALVGISAQLVSVKAVDSSLMPTPSIPGFHNGMKIAVLPIGWGDGLPTGLLHSMEGLLNGTRVALFGPSHLEHIRVDVSSVKDARIGDTVYLLGGVGQNAITLEELSNMWGVEEVQIYGSLRDHVRRRFV